MRPIGCPFESRLLRLNLLLFLSIASGFFAPISHAQPVPVTVNQESLEEQVDKRSQGRAAKKLTKVTLQLKWKHQFQFAGFYAALEKGFYREAGFDVELKAIAPGIEPVEEVLSGRAQFGLSNSELALYRMQGKPVTSLAAIIQHSPIVLLSLKKSNILSPQDLIGKRVMYPQGVYGANTAGLLLKEGVQLDQITSVPLSYNIDDLIEGRVDAMVGYSTDQPYQLQIRGVEYNIIEPRSYGIDFYGDVLFAHQQYVEDNPQKVEAFRQASIRGWEYAVKNSEEVIDWLLDKYHSEKTAEELRYEAKETIKLIVAELVQVGHTNDGRWKHISQVFLDLGLANEPLNLNEFIYLPERRRSEDKIMTVLQITSVLAGVLLTVLIIMYYFHRRLRLSVESQTKELVDKTKELEMKNILLERHSNELNSSRDELNKLNQELESRVEIRTQTVNQMNELLMREVKQGTRREMSLQLLHHAIDNSNAIVLIVDAELNIAYVSRALVNYVGSEKSELMEKHFSVLEGAIPLPDEELLRDEAILQKKHTSEESGTDNKGNHYWLKMTLNPLFNTSKDLSHCVVVYEDITSIKQRKDEMEKLALYDTLTGLENRTLFKIRIEKAIHRAERNDIKTALLFIDIDHFKEVNDTLGHDSGDELLKTIAHRMRLHVRENDPVARISGDEFTILLTDIHQYSDASKVAEHILDSLQQPISVNGGEAFVTASIGISVTPDDATDVDEFIKHADLAMYQAKRGGRNGYRFFSQEMNLEITRKSTIEKELGQAIKQQDFFLLFQPKVCLKTNRINGAEGLIRWQYSANSVREPDLFIGIAEETGQIVPIGYWVIQQAIETLHSINVEQLDSFTLSINISPRQLKAPDFVEKVKQMFASCPSLTQYIELEITENSFIDDNEDNINRLHQLKALGFSISIDDFGTGYSSLGYLQKLPVDTLKIDRSFINGLPHNRGNVNITESVIALAHNFELLVIAEGVESEEQRLFLLEQGCDIAQGFYFAHPLALSEFINQLHSYPS